MMNFCRNRVKYILIINGVTASQIAVTNVLYFVSQTKLYFFRQIGYVRSIKFCLILFSVTLAVLYSELIQYVLVCLQN